MTAAAALTEKLQKVLARAGLASRRIAEEWIAAGRVTVNGRIATLGERIAADDEVRVDGRRIEVATGDEMERQVIAYHKQEGEVVSRNDPEGRPSVFDQLPALRGQRWVSVGRLDLHTSGLLLLTNDGELANRLMHPSTAVEREFAVRIEGELSAEKKRVLLDGVMLDDGLSKFLAITDAGSQGTGHWYRCSLVGGKFREVRRLWESQGYVVGRLVRIRFGSFSMPSTLRQGHWLELSGDDIARLEQLCRLPPKKHTGLYGRSRRLSDRQERGAREASGQRRDDDDDIDGNRMDGGRHEGNRAGGGERPRSKGGYLRGRR
ncbi:MAG: pseudouridine synthase [Pseudomonadota bacterium]